MLVVLSDLLPTLSLRVKLLLDILRIDNNYEKMDASRGKYALALTARYTVSFAPTRHPLLLLAITHRLDARYPSPLLAILRHSLCLDTLCNGGYSLWPLCKRRLK